MQLNNYYNLKTVKLNDSFVVYMHNLQQRNNDNKKVATTGAWDPDGNLGDSFNTAENATGIVDDRLVELYTCTEVQLPSYKYTVESHQVGNTIYKAILPDYEAQPTVSITLAETNDRFIEKLLKLLIRRNIRDGGTNMAQYVDNGWLDLLAVDVLSNDLHKVVMRYQFGFCRLVDYQIYDLSYAADELPTYHLTFTFESFKKLYNPDRASLEAIIGATRNHLDWYNTMADKPGAAKADTKATAPAKDSKTSTSTTTQTKKTSTQTATEQSKKKAAAEKKAAKQDKPKQTVDPHAKQCRADAVDFTYAPNFELDLENPTVLSKPATTETKPKQDAIDVMFGNY